MIDYNKKIVAALKTIGIPVHYELFLNSGLEVPCISYMELTNYVEQQTFDLGTDVCKISFQVKVWGTRIEDLQKYAKEIDVVMRNMYFVRTSSVELHDPNSAMMQKVLTYDCIAIDNFK